MFDKYARLLGIDTEDTDDTAEPDYDAHRVTKWTLGDHSMRPNTNPDDLYADARMNEGVDDELAALLKEASERLDTARIHDFECPVCGLGHGHSDTKHDIRAGFNVTEDFAEEMEFNPFCHCGVNELAMLVDFHDLFEVPMFDDEDDLTADELDARFAEIRQAASNADVSDAVHSRLEVSREELEAVSDAQDDVQESPVEDGDGGGFVF